MTEYAQLFWRSFQNLIVKILAQILNLALIPIYVTYLDISDYGIINIAFIFINFYTLFSISGLSDALIRFYAKAKNSELKKRIFTTSLISTTLISATFFIVIWFFNQEIAQLFFNDSSLNKILLLVLFTGILESWNLLIVMLLQSEKRTKLYGFAIISKNLVKIILTFFFLVYFDLGLTGAMIAILAGSLTLILICLPLILARLSIKISKRVFKILFSYGIPFVLTGLAINLLFQVDQLILKFMIGLEAVAIYGLSYKLGSAIQYFNSSFSLTWFPYLFEKNNDEARRKLIKLLKPFSVVLFSLGVILLILNNFFLGMLLPEKYLAAINIIPWILWGYIIFALSDFLSVGLFIRYKSKTIALIAGLATILNILLNIFFINLYGIIAAAIVTFITLTLFTIVSAIISNRYFPLKINYLPYLKIMSFYVFLILMGSLRIFDDQLINILYGGLLITITIFLTFKFKFLEILQVKNLFFEGKINQT